MSWKKLPLALVSAVALAVTTGSLALAASPAATPPFVGGLPLAPWVLVFGFLVLAEAMWLMNPAKVSGVATGTVATLGGVIVMVNGYLIMNNPATMGALAGATGFVTAFTIVYGFFFTALGIIQIQGEAPTVLGPVAMFIAFFSLAVALVFLSAGATYHALILGVVFVAFALTSLALGGKVPLKNVGYWLSLTSVMLIIPGFLWALAPSLWGSL